MFWCLSEKSGRFVELGDKHHLMEGVSRRVSKELDPTCSITHMQLYMYNKTIKLRVQEPTELAIVR